PRPAAATSTTRRCPRAAGRRACAPPRRYRAAGPGGARRGPAGSREPLALGLVEPRELGACVREPVPQRREPQGEPPGAPDAVGVGSAAGEDRGDPLLLGGQRGERLLRLRAAGREERGDPSVVDLVGEEQPPEERLARVLRLERRSE